jgi:hypothetical protein
MVDLYTKMILSLIAISLAAIAGQMAMRDAVAQNQSCGWTAHTPCFVTTQPEFVDGSTRTTYLRTVVIDR